MKVAVLGAGRWGSNIIKTLGQLGSLGGIFDSAPSAGAKAETLAPGARVFKSLEEALESELPAVAIATPAATHFEVASMALRGGKHVFVEKPMTLSVGEAERLVELARAQKRVLMVGHLLVYQPAIQWIAKQLRDGAYGSVQTIHQTRLGLGQARANENVLWSFGVHDVAVALYLMESSVQTVKAWGSSAITNGVEDDVYLNLSFESGATLNAHFSWLWPQRERRLVIVTDRAMLVYDELEQKVVLHKKSIGSDFVSQDGGSEAVFSGDGEPLKLELAHFVECIRDGREPLTSGASAVPVIRVLERASERLRKSGEHS